MKKLLLILALFISISAFSQTDTTTSNISSDWVKSPTEDKYILKDIVPFSALLLVTLLATQYLYKTHILRKVNQDKTKWQTNL